MENEEKRMIGSYQVENSIYLGNKEVVFGVDKNEQYPFIKPFYDILLIRSLG